VSSLTNRAALASQPRQGPSQGSWRLEGNFGAVHTRSTGAGAIGLWMDDGADEEVIELVPEKGKEAETNRFSELGCGDLNTGIASVVKESFACHPLVTGRGKMPDVGCQDSKDIESQ